MREKMNLITTLMSELDTPIIMENIYINLLSKPIIIDATSGREYFSGTPEWLNELENGKKYIVIRNIDYISKEEQTKLIELLKYKKVGINKLDENTRIFLTVDNMDFNNINEDIISLTVQV